MLQQIQQVIDDQCPQLLRCSSEPRCWRMSLGADVEVVLTADDAGLLFRAGPLADADSEAEHPVQQDRSGKFAEWRVVEGAGGDEHFIEVGLRSDNAGRISPSLFSLGLSLAIADVGMGYLLKLRRELFAGVFALATKHAPPRQPIVDIAMGDSARVAGVEPTLQPSLGTATHPTVDAVRSAAPQSWSGIGRAGLSWLANVPLAIRGVGRRR